MKEFKKDCKYIWETIRGEFQLMAFIKISLIPLVIGLVTWLISFWESLKIPGWVWVPVTVFVSSVCILFVLARKCRILEEPNFDIELDFSGIPVQSADGGKEYKFINICVTSQSETPARDFIAHLISLSKDGRDVPLGTSPVLGWDSGYQSKNVIQTIFPGTTNIIHVARVTREDFYAGLDNVTSDLTFGLDEVGGTRPARTFEDGGIYNFEVVINNMKTISKKITLEVIWGKNWENISVKEKGIENVTR